MAPARHPAAFSVPPGLGLASLPSLRQGQLAPAPFPGGCATVVAPHRSIPMVRCGPAVAPPRGTGGRGCGERGGGGSCRAPWGLPAPSSLPSCSRPRMHRQVCCLSHEVPDATLPPPSWHLARAHPCSQAPGPPRVPPPQGIQHAAVNLIT